MKENSHLCARGPTRLAELAALAKQLLLMSARRESAYLSGNPGGLEARTLALHVEPCFFHSTPSTFTITRLRRWPSNSA